MLLTHDRMGMEEFPLTQGIPRPAARRAASVDIGCRRRAARSKFIRYHRGRVSVINRTGLEAASCQCYRALREVFDRLIP